MNEKKGWESAKTAEQVIADAQASAVWFEEVERHKAERAIVIPAGVEALKRLLPIAQKDTGQSRIIAGFLLGLYNGRGFPFCLTDFRGLDRKLFDDCQLVLKMDACHCVQEIHDYFVDGGAIFQKLANVWFPKPKKKPKI